MKRNAIIRIIIWSVVLLLLSGILAAGLFGAFNMGFGQYAYSKLEAVPTEVTAPTTASEAFPSNATVTANAVNVRQSPHSEAEVMGVVYRGDRIMVTRIESIGGVAWAYTTSPTAGWIKSEYINMLSDAELTDSVQDVNVTDLPQIEETMVTADTEGKNTFAASAIRELKIEWAAGDILIQPGNTDQIIIKEDGVTEDKYAMVLNQEGDTLKIRYCSEILGRGFGISFGTVLAKDLTIYVPIDWYCKSLEIEAASASVEINDMNIGEVDFDGASGICELENCTVGEIDIDTASGDVRFIGSLDILKCDAASASVYAVLSNIPSRLDMDMISGDLELTLPADAGFTLAMDGPSSNFTTDFETTVKNGNTVTGDGFCRINVEALSGSVTISKAAE